MNGVAVRGPPPLRCFIALRPDANGLDALQHCSETSQCVPGVRWVGRGALHLTLRFLGATEPAQIRQLGIALPRIATPVPAIAPQGYGRWPRARPRLLVLDLEPDPQLAALADACEAAAREAAFSPERRTFRPHVTLARLHAGGAPDLLPDPPRHITFDRLVLMQSILARPQAIYRTLLDAPLTRTRP